MARCPTHHAELIDGRCPGGTILRAAVTCTFHLTHPLEHTESPRFCECRAALGAACTYVLPEPELASKGI